MAYMLIQLISKANQDAHLVPELHAHHKIVWKKLGKIDLYHPFSTAQQSQ